MQILEKSFDWIFTNADVLFSGIGTFLIGLVLPRIIRLKAIYSARRRNNALVGKWKASFNYIKNDTVNIYTEIIQLNRKGGKVIGHIIEDDRNYERLRLVHRSHPLRLEGEFRENRFFTGTWYHPIETNRFFGSFQLQLETTNRLVGVWIGLSEAKNAIDNGKWEWNKL